MNTVLRTALVVAGLVAATQSAAEITFFEHNDFTGRSFTARARIDDFARYGFNDRASSVVVQRDQWEVCQDTRLGGHCVVLGPGRYSSLGEMGLNDRITSVRLADRRQTSNDTRYVPYPAASSYQGSGGEITFYEHDGFAGRSFTTKEQIGNFGQTGFNDRASSVLVSGERWEVCEDARFGGRCVVLRPGRYASLSAMGLNDRVSSVRIVDGNSRIDDNRYAPAPVAAYDYRRRNNERLYEANVTSVRAVLGPPEERCWVEREQVTGERSRANVPGAVVGGIIGGILGHQIGSGRGNDAATAGGAIAGAVVGSNVGRDGQPGYSRDVRRCENVSNRDQIDHWDVTYDFRGQEYRMQMSAPPGPTVTVNNQGEPRA